ncbi:MAG: hypothetical protein WKH64_12255 [Chloroflexia bacterium]
MTHVPAAASASSGNVRPTHNGHLAAAEEIIPATAGTRRVGARRIAAAQGSPTSIAGWLSPRLLRLAVENNSKFEIDEIELRLEDRLHRSHTNGDARQVRGEQAALHDRLDEFANLSEWRQPEVVVRSRS